MKGLLDLIRRTFLSRQLDFRVRLFNVLAIAGALISLILAVAGIFTGAGYVNIAANLASMLLSCGLLRYSYQSGNYQLCYLITIVAIFMVLFPVLFFSAGGYHSGMPCFFVFAVLFTIFMLDGKRAFAIGAAELVLYTGCCLIAYYRPEFVKAFASEEDILIDIMIGFLCVSVSLGITMFLHFGMYNRQQRELESARKEALRLSEIKSAFLANMSHEIRTPINVILGMNEMVLRESDSEQITGFAGNIQNAGKTLLTLINNILDVSKIESGKMEVLEEAYPLADLIRDLSVIGGERAAKKGLDFLLEIDETLPTELCGDFIHVKQVVVNFLSNAVKYTESGSVTLSFCKKPGRLPEDILLCVTVTDTGIGIRKEDQAGLFDAFTRVDLPAHRNIEGTGLGLAIARQLTQLMDGSIRMRSVWGEGSAFSAEIPQTVRNAMPLGKSPVPGAASIPARAEESFVAPKGRILAVDDNAENLQVIRELLRRTLLRVDTASSGRECLQMLEEKQYHAVLLDYMMPDMDGIEVFRGIRSAFSGFSTPVIALTANAVAGAEEMFRKEGFTAYLSKPVMWKALEDALLACLPAELVSRTVPAGPAVYPRARQELEKELAQHDISLRDGLKYLCGDLRQYLKLAGFFAENYQDSRAETERLFRRENWSALVHPVHSLKSKAKALGAFALHDTAARLEKRCMTGDGEYIRCAMPLLSLQWGRAADGLNAALLRANALLPPEDARAETDPPTAQALLKCIHAFRRADAEAMINRMLASAVRQTEHAALTEVKDAVNALDFEEAENLLLALMDERSRDPASAGRQPCAEAVS